MTTLIKPCKSILLGGIVTFMLTSALNLWTMPEVYAQIPIKNFDLEAHRGGRDARPENTLISFAYALELGVTTLEMDMQLTRDGHIVISHNPIMSPNLTKSPDGKYVKEGQYDIRTMTLAQIKQFDVGTMNPAAGDYFDSHGKTQVSVPGTTIPTLEEVFDLVNSYGNNTIMFNIETKSYPDPIDAAYKNNPDPAVFAKKVYEIIKKYHMENRVALQSFDWRTLKEMHKLDPNITLVALSNEQPSWGPGGCSLKIGDKKPSPWLAGLNINDFKGDYVKAAKAIGADVVSPYYEELSPTLVNEAHALGMKVIPWTVNNLQDMNNLIAMGVDGLITDKPWQLRELLIKRGIKVATPTINPSSPYHTGISLSTTAGEARQLAGGGDAAH
ncbi:MAG: glycerophosphoryl diester phosphodiesterase [Firmicutes bacterium]|nr:glycerophosphoryl diester phosphodiesterase [Bacillota bacterium]